MPEPTIPSGEHLTPTEPCGARCLCAFCHGSRGRDLAAAEAKLARAQAILFADETGYDFLVGVARDCVRLGTDGPQHRQLVALADVLSTDAPAPYVFDQEDTP